MTMTERLTLDDREFHEGLARLQTASSSASAKVASNWTPAAAAIAALASTRVTRTTE